MPSRIGYTVFITFSLIIILLALHESHSFPGDDKKPQVNIPPALPLESPQKKEDTKPKEAKKDAKKDKPVETTTASPVAVPAVDNSQMESTNKVTATFEEQPKFRDEKSIKCPGITCGAPPKDAKCIITTSTKINPMFPLMGSKGDCCPAHVCQRSDGSFFTHYAIEVDGYSGFPSSNWNPQQMQTNDISSYFSPSFPSFPESPFYPNQLQFGNSLQPLAPNPYYGPSNNRVYRNAEVMGPPNQMMPMQMQQSNNNNNWGFYNRARRHAPQPQFFGPLPAGVFGQQQILMH